MLYHTSRSDLKPYISAGHQARSRAFFDLANWLGRALITGWTRIRSTLTGHSGTRADAHNHPSGAMHA